MSVMQININDGDITGTGNKKEEKKDGAKTNSAKPEGDKKKFGNLFG